MKFILVEELEIGSPIKNYSGSYIKRHTNPNGVKVGKAIGDGIYAHINYLYDVVPEEYILRANELLHKNGLYDKAYSFNCFKWSPKKHVLLFQEGPDFDTAREPVVGRIINVNIDTGKVIERPFNNSIWHHKWLWVDNDYKGFDVEDSWNWSKEYSTKIKESPYGNDMMGWKQQLKKYGLE